jgi:secondary thiamine-phosphate synthase enzyme
MVHGEEFTVQTKGYSDIRDITGQVRRIIDNSSIAEGIVTVHAVGSTASISTIEFEPALNADFKDELEKFIPSSLHTRHSQTWGDDNGFSHIRATFMGPSITVPITKGTPVLGTWQQIIVIDHDNRPRSRSIFVQVMGEK